MLLSGNLQRASNGPAFRMQLQKERILFAHCPGTIQNDERKTAGSGLTNPAGRQCRNAMPEPANGSRTRMTAEPRRHVAACQPLEDDLGASRKPAHLAGGQPCCGFVGGSKERLVRRSGEPPEGDKRAPILAPLSGESPRYPSHESSRGAPIWLTGKASF
jgi:hypothetical protein